MKQLTSHLLLLLLFSSHSYAQSNYKPGYLVTTTGDTLQGHIDYREWGSNPKSISFRTSAHTNAAQVFNPGNSSYFKISGMEAYRSYEGPITMHRVDKKNLAYGSADNSVATEKVFLRMKQQGPVVTLYTYKDDIKERYFIAEQGSNAPQELLYKRYFKATNSAKVVTQRFYVGQLLNVARHQGTLTDRLQREIESAAYTEQDLQKVIGLLNGLSDHEIELERKSKVTSDFFAGVALSRGTMTTYGKDEFANVDETNGFYMPRLAFGFDAYLNGNVQQLVLRLEGSLTNANHHVQKTYNTGGGGYDELAYAMDQQTASLSPQIIYNLYNKENLKFYIGGGLALNYSNYSKNHYQRQHFYASQAGTLYERDTYKVLLPIWYSHTIRAGVVLKNKYELSAMYLAPGTITRYTSSEIKTGSTNVGINYLFRK